MRIGIRWWLSAACALVAAVTATAGALFAGARAEDALRERAQDLAAGAAFAAAVELAREPARDRLAVIEGLARRRGLSLWLLDDTGRRVSGFTSRRIPFSAVPDTVGARRAAREGSRYISTHRELNATTVGLPLSPGGLIVYAPQPELRENVGIVRSELLHAAGFAVVAGGIVGLLVAVLTARRLRRIGDVARAIEQGDFDTPARRGLDDEIGDLALGIDSMRVRLKESFDDVTSGRERFRRLLERLHEGVIAIDRHGRIEFVNGRARTLLQLDLVPGDELPDIWPQSPLRQLAGQLRSGRAELVEARVELDDDRAFLVVGVAPRREEEGAMIVVTDISERERRERAERQFVANASHELRTPVATIIGAVDVLQTGAKDSPADRDLFLSHIQHASARLGLLAETLLVLARVQARQQEPELEPVRMRPLLEDVARQLAPADDVTVEVDCASGVEALAEPSLLYHALMNLGQNAAAHTEHGRIILAAVDGGGEVTVEVRDTGAGIASAEQGRVFERFYRPHRHGTNGFGLGLSIVRQAVTAQRARLELESVEGVGTTFRIRLERPEDGP